jgi:hypothetical protein
LLAAIGNDKYIEQTGNISRNLFLFVLHLSSEKSSIFGRMEEQVRTDKTTTEGFVNEIKAKSGKAI